MNSLYEYLEEFGVDKRSCDVYLELVNRGNSTVQELSRYTKISRPTLYRILDTLNVKNLIAEQIIDGKKTFVASPVTQLEVLLQQQKRDIEMTEALLPSAIQQLAEVQSKGNKQSHIVTYHGIQGLKTVTWNSTKAKGELCIFEMEQDMSAFLDFDFSERIRMEFLKQGLTSVRQLTNYKKIDAWTNLTEFVDITEFKYLDPKVFSLHLEVVVYNDIVAMYQYKQKDILCFEIHNADVAKMYREMFNHFWSQGQKMKILDERGSAKVVIS